MAYAEHVHAVPLLVSAQGVRLFAYIVALVAQSGWWTAPDAVSPQALLVVAILIELLGYLDLSFRTTGVARVVFRMLALAPGFYVVLVFAVNFSTSTVDTTRTIGGFAVWAYAAHMLGGIVALWLTARRVHAVAVAALVLSAFGTVVPQLDRELVREVLTATGLPGQGLLVFGPPVLVGVLAIFAGKSAEPLSIATARVGRTLGRAPLGLIALAIWAIVQLASSVEGNRAAPVFAFVGLALLVIAAYRARVLRGIAATVIASYALVVVMVAVVGSARERVELPASATAAIVAAIAALVIVAVRAAPARRRIVAAIAFGGSGIAAIALPYDAGTLALLVAEAAAMYVLRNAGRELAVVPQATVADVFA